MEVDLTNRWTSRSENNLENTDLKEASKFLRYIHIFSMRFLVLFFE